MAFINVKTSNKHEMVDITANIQEQIDYAGIYDGLCMIFVPHTTAAVTINENADPNVRGDILLSLNEIVREDARFQHIEGNSTAHVKASLIGSSELIAIENGKLALGTWQGIFLCDFDGPRTRKVNLKFLT